MTGPGSSPSFGFTERIRSTVTVSGAITFTSTAISRCSSNTLWTCSTSAVPGTPPADVMTTSTVPSPRFFGNTFTAHTPSTASVCWA